MAEDPKEPKGPADPGAQEPPQQPGAEGGGGAPVIRRSPRISDLVAQLRTRAASGEPVRVSLPDPHEIAGKYDVDRIKAAADALKRVRPELEGAYEETVRVEALGDPEYQQALVEANVLRRRLSVLADGNFENTRIADLLKQLNEVDGGLFDLRQQGIEGRIDKEKKLLEAQHRRERVLRKLDGNNQLTEGHDRAKLRAQLLTLAEEADEIERQFRHRAAVQPRLEEEARAVTVNAIPDVITRMYKEGDERLRSVEDMLKGLRGRGVMIVTLLSQLTSGFLSASGIAAMGTKLSSFPPSAVWSIALCTGLALNGSLYWLTRGHQTGAWRFFTERTPPPIEPPQPPSPLPEGTGEGDNGEGDEAAVKEKAPKKPGRSFWQKLRFPTGMAFAYLGLSALSGASNIGGAMRIMVPIAVVQSAMGKKIDDVTGFTAQARKGLTPKSDSANKAIADLRKQAQTLFEETVARGKTQQYGFRNESQNELRNLNDLYQKLVEQMGNEGNCGALDALQKIYDTLYDKLNAEYERMKARYAAAPFDKSLGNLGANIKTCQEKSPASPADLANEIDGLAKQIVADVEGGKIQDPTELNPRINELNTLMAKLGATVDVKAIQLDPMDPPMFEAAKLIWESFTALLKRLWSSQDNAARERLLLYPIVIALFSEIIDQIGIILSFLLIANEKRYLRKLRERKTLIASGQIDNIDNP